ncbi:rod shape-determining protein MreD [Marseilla massiliensis]|jgi:rod shape-determining protein MreD|uniref:Rod shape-determining protein MreD n=1 Tax=Marseilla massiliensis TaxID=1841864 RepID=A0A938WWX1_9BACT|nr:rod shape-determining protein MreD [Marseilla massiliensis]MBM6674584.1 rod shape-determining protein MreD [Marseilla massiliensis]
MKIEVIRHFFTFIILCIVQVLVLNHIELFGCATPFLYVYFIMLFRRGFPRWAVLLWSFFLGIFIDMFSNTPGVAASSATFIGLLQPYLLNLFAPRDSSDDMMPTMKSLGVARYVYYTIICVFIFNLLFFTVEMFSFFNWLQWALNICGSTVLTVVLILVIENVRKR